MGGDSGLSRVEEKGHQSQALQRPTRKLKHLMNRSAVSLWYGDEIRISRDAVQLPIILGISPDANIAMFFAADGQSLYIKSPDERYYLTRMFRH